MTVVCFYIVTFKFREDDIIHELSPFNTVRELFVGMKKIWFNKIPGIFVIPLSVVLLLYVICFGGTLIVKNFYLR